jgi:hypothetical protein
MAAANISRMGSGSLIEQMSHGLGVAVCPARARPREALGVAEALRGDAFFMGSPSAGAPRLSRLYSYWTGLGAARRVAKCS